jgi:hypothetical protein
MPTYGMDHFVLLPSNPCKSPELQPTTIYRIPNFCLNKPQHRAKAKELSPSRTPWNHGTAAGTDGKPSATSKTLKMDSTFAPLTAFNWHYSLCSRRAGYLGLWPPVWQQKHSRLDEKLPISSRSSVSKTSQASNISI